MFTGCRVVNALEHCILQTQYLSPKRRETIAKTLPPNAEVETEDLLIACITAYSESNVRTLVQLCYPDARFESITLV